MRHQGSPSLFFEPWHEPGRAPSFARAPSTSCRKRTHTLPELERHTKIARVTLSFLLVSGSLSMQIVAGFWSPSWSVTLSPSSKLIFNRRMSKELNVKFLDKVPLHIVRFRLCWGVVTGPARDLFICAVLQPFFWALSPVHKVKARTRYKMGQTFLSEEWSCDFSPELYTQANTAPSAQIYS